MALKRGLRGSASNAYPRMIPLGTLNYGDRNSFYIETRHAIRKDDMPFIIFIPK